MDRPLTDLQTRVLDYIDKHRAARYRDIMPAVGVNGVGSVQAVIRALAKKGYVAPRREPGKWIIYAKFAREGKAK